MVLQAREGDAASRRALETLCSTYRAPVLAYIRRGRDKPQDAEDLAQAFFTRLVERGFLPGADPERGRFRTYLLTTLQRFLKDASVSSRAVKRGGGIHHHSFEESGTFTGSNDSVPGVDSPEREFDRAWAQAVLRSAMGRLQAEARAAGRLPLFDSLAEFLIEPPDDCDYARIAEALNLRRNTLAVAVHRMRHRLREFVCEELAQTAADAGNLEQELDELRDCLGSVL